MYLLKKYSTVIFILSLTIITSITSCSAKKSNLNSYSFGGNFTLTTHNNTKFELNHIKGKIALIFFGYTLCPDACPQALYTLKQTFSLLSKEDTKKVQILFISVDPKRDKLANMKKFLESFKIGILGLSGTEQEIKKVASQYKAFYKKNFSSNSKLGYLIDHSTYIYLIDQNSKVRYLFKHKAKPKFIKDTIKELI